jgi:invasion protein IalB
MAKFQVLAVLGALSVLGSECALAEASRQVIGDWVVTCTTATAGHKSCMMTQTLASEKLGKTVSVFTVGRDHAGKLKASIRVPVGVSLPDGVLVDIASGDRFKVPYSACHRVGCFAPFDLSEPLLGKMRKATKISALVQSASRQPLALNFSARGFPAAYERYVQESR